MKRLIVLCDGTGNSATRGSEELSTNVKRFADALEPTLLVLACNCKVKSEKKYVGVPRNGSPRNTRCSQCNVERVKVPQITYYQSGVGTGTGMGDLSQTWQLGTGAGINDNILDAYHFLANNYKQGDEIFIFGFSRGAFTARVLANLVVQLGLFHKDRLWMMRKAWNQYIKADDGISFKYFVEQLWKIDPNYTRAVTVKVLGVWDTVDSVGAPDYMENKNWIASAIPSAEFYQPHLVYGIEHVFHALALDEYRRTFNPTLFFLPDPKEQGDKPPINLRQCWFPGVHSNIGGSYPSEHLADITLAWMVDQCVNNGDLLMFNTYLLDRYVGRHLNPEENRDSFHTGGEKNYPGWGCGTIYDSYSGKKSFMTWQYRTPGNYCSLREHRGSAGFFQLPEIKFPKWVPYLGSSTPTPSDDVCQDCIHPGRHFGPVKGATNETIHASVFARYKASAELENPAAREKRESLLKDEKLAIDALNNHTNRNSYWPQPLQEKAKAVSLLKWNPEALAAFKRDGVQDDSKLDRYIREKDETGAWRWTGRCLKTGKKFYMYEEPDVKAEVCGLANPYLQDSVYVYKTVSPVGDMITKMKMKPDEFKKYIASKGGNRLRTQAEEDAALKAHKYLTEGFKVDEAYKTAELERRKAEKDRRS